MSAMQIRLFVLAALATGCARTADPTPSAAGQGGSAAAAAASGGTGGGANAGSSGSAGSAGQSACDALARDCGFYGAACCEPTECGGEPCDDGLLCCADGRCSADCVDVPFCVPVCTGDATADDEVAAACGAIADGQACRDHETGGFPASCRWVTPLSISCSSHCSARDQESCESEGVCVEQFAYRARADRRAEGSVFAACSSIADACDGGDEVLTCASSPSGELFVFPTTCIPPDWTTRPDTDCDEGGLPDCRTLDVEACASSAWCRTIDGRLDDADDAGAASEPLGCAAHDQVCGDAETCAREGEGGPEYRFPTTCIPAGWLACDEP